HAQPGRADAPPVMLNRPLVMRRLGWCALTFEVLPGVVPAAVPLPPPCRPVSILLFRVDRMGEPVVDVGIPAGAQDDAVTSQHRQFRQAEPVTHAPRLAAPLARPRCGGGRGASRRRGWRSPR